jgi:hypothetical protein
VSGYRAITIVLVDLLVLGAALIWEAWKETLAPVSWAVAAVGLVTFFGVLTDGHARRTRAQTRFALSIAITTTYLVVLGLIIFKKVS